MLKANEAWIITQEHDKYTEKLIQIEALIRNAAERGSTCTWWYCENMTDYERKNLAKRLEEFGYIITVSESVIYINWRDASKE